MTSSISQRLKDAVAAARRGELDAAEEICRSLLKTRPDDADALQILGLTLKTKGEFDAAGPYFRRSLELNPAQPHILNNYGNLLIEMNDLQGAEKAYLAALELAPQSAESLAGLASVYLGMGEAAKAFEKSRELLTLNSQSARGFCLAGRALRLFNEYDTAVASFIRAIEINPNYFDARFHLGVAHTWAGEPAKAVEHLLKATEIEPRSAYAFCQLGHAYNNLGELDAALRAYKRAIALKADCVEAHDMLNKICFELQLTDEYLQSYPDAIARAPTCRELYLQYAQFLSLTHSTDDAFRVLREAEARCGPDSSIARAAALVDARLANWGGAIARFERALEQAPDDVASLEGLTRILIITKDYGRARGYVNKVKALAPFDQQNIAYEWLYRRLSGDEGADALYDFEALVRSYEITPSNEYGDIASFNRALAIHLHALHTTRAHPIDQTLRAGTQTHGFLFDSPAPIISAIKESVERAVQSYVDDLPRDPDHAFLSRNTGAFALAGSWSVRLGEGGHHVNHIHSSGWISSAYYVELPDDLDAEKREGWIKFGETDLMLGEREHIGKMIEPVVGKLVLFPSYMYHGTVPIKSKKPRMTIAFDAVPA